MTTNGVDNAPQVFHLQFALMSDHAVDTTRIEPWDHYLARLDSGDVAPRAVANLRVLWERAHREHQADEGMRATVERWFDRAQRRVNARPGWARTEPTPW